MENGESVYRRKQRQASDDVCKMANPQLHGDVSVDREEGDRVGSGRNGRR